MQVSSSIKGPVLLACGIDPQQPGEYNITFTATSSTGLSASVHRRLIIKAACPEGEKLCPDKVRSDPRHPLALIYVTYCPQHMMQSCFQV